MEREKLINLALKNFLKDLFESLKPFQTLEERVDFLEILVEYMKGAYSYEPPIPALGMEGTPFDGEGFIRKNILLKFKQKSKAFVDTGLRYYFEKNDDLKQHLFGKLNIDEPVLTDEEFEVYINYVNQLLHNIIEKICTESFDAAKTDTEKELSNIAEGDEKKGKFKSQSKEYTRSRQIILFHYVLQLIGKSRHDTSLLQLAEFGHVLFAWPTDNANNNAVYRMLKEAPYLKENEKALLKDLEFVKKQFERIGHTEGVALVQKEINGLK